MEENILEHYRKTSTYTYAGAYGEYFRSLPDDIPMLGRLVCGQVIHRVTLKEGNTNAQLAPLASAPADPVIPAAPADLRNLPGFLHERDFPALRVNVVHPVRVEIPQPVPVHQIKKDGDTSNTSSAWILWRRNGDRSPTP